MFRLKDRHGRDMCLGMTHEEVVAWLAVQGDPLLPRAAAGLVPDPDEGAGRGAPAVGRAPDARVLDEGRVHAGRGRGGAGRRLRPPEGGVRPDLPPLRTRLPRRRVRRRHDGRTGRARVHGARARPGRTRSRVARPVAMRPTSSSPGRGLRRLRFPDAPREEVATPGVRTIAEVCALLGVDPAQTIKSLLYVGPSGPLLALVRGDQQLHEKKLARLLGGEVRSAHADEVRDALGDLGRLGGPRGRLGAGRGGRGARRRRIRRGSQSRRRPSARRPAGAGLHGAATPTSTWPRPGTRVRSAARPSWWSASSRSGTSSSSGRSTRRRSGATYLDEQGQARPIVMGSYGIGPARIVASAIEQRHDADGIVWPWSIAPAQVHVLPVNVKQAPMRETAERLYRELGAAGFETILDDRDERPGVKFKDADLLGLPIRVTVGARLAKDGKVEVRSATEPPGRRGLAGRGRRRRPGPRPAAGRRPLAPRAGRGDSSTRCLGVY